MKRIGGDERLVLYALGAIVVVTAGWWALALWPVEAAPEWLERTRAVCFGSAPGGLPDAGGWILLIGQPLSMAAFLLLVWGGAVRRALSAVSAARGGRAALAGLALVIGVGLLSAGVRVAGAVSSLALEPEGLDAASHPRLDREPPPLELVDQHGTVFDLDQTRGQRVLLTFVYAHCETVCPLIVQDVLAARQLVPEREATVVIVSIDPWRDTPSRLPSIARQWALGATDHVLSGEVGAVLAVLEAWNVPITRQEKTGVIDHPAVVYVIDPSGRIAFATTGGAERIAELLRRS